MYDQIHTTYVNRFSELDTEHQFHFASRLKLVCGDLWARDQVASLRDTILNSSIDTSLDMLCVRKPDVRDVNAPQLRLPLFERHAWLYSYELMLFFGLHAKIQYAVDASEQIRARQSIDQDMLSSIFQNPTELAILSTYFINMFYLHTRLIEHDSRLIPLENIKRALGVALDDPNEARLKVYLLTHCILGETLFYARPVPEELKTYYETIGVWLAALLVNSWHALTLDAKLEGAYCLQLLSMRSDLQDRARSDAEAQYDSALGYIVDSRSKAKNSLQGAEHRNVLYLMLTHPA